MPGSIPVTTAGTTTIGYRRHNRSRGFGGRQEHRCAAFEKPHHCSERLLGHSFGFIRVAGQRDMHRDRFGRWAFELPHHQLAGVGRGPPVHLASAVPGAIRTRTPRLADIGLGPLHGRTGLIVVPEGKKAGAPTARRDMES